MIIMGWVGGGVDTTGIRLLYFSKHEPSQPL